MYLSLDSKVMHGKNVIEVSKSLGCIHPSKQHLACFFICQHCGNAEELVESQTLQQEIQRRALDLGFSIQQSILEVAAISWGGIRVWRVVLGGKYNSNRKRIPSNNEQIRQQQRGNQKPSTFRKLTKAKKKISRCMRMTFL